MRGKRFLALGLVPLAAATAAVTSAAYSSASPASSAIPAAPAVAASPIRHVIEIMIENHTFDNLFGRFRGADGIPSNTSLLNPGAYFVSEPPVRPAWATGNEGSVQYAINNSTVGEQMAMDYEPGRGYLMDHYTVFPQDGISAITEFGPAFDPDEQYLAAHYELADHNFQPVIGPTQPNVLTALTGTDHGWIYNNRPPGSAPWNSIFDELTAHGRTWKIYWALPTYIFDGSVWDRLLPPEQLGDLTTAQAFFNDLAHGGLPDFSFVRPGVGYSTEPPEDVTEGDAWIGQLVNAVARSRYWDSTAIFVTYDESGGFWDHVPPSAASGYGPRTPMIIISPYARRGVFHAVTTNVSILSFMQRMWGMPALTGLNARQNDLFSAFNFRQRPLPAPRVPVAPAVTIGFHGDGGLLTDISAPAPGRSLPIYLMAETGGLEIDTAVSGHVRLTVIPPRGVARPRGFPGVVRLSHGLAYLTARFRMAGYYRIVASGPDGSKGWVTVDVGVTPDTAP
jgi:phospholipase C